MKQDMFSSPLKPCLCHLPFFEEVIRPFFRFSDPFNGGRWL
jgi:hypothetical protein